MGRPGRSEVVIYAICALVVGYFGLRELRAGSSPSPSRPAVTVARPAGGSGARKTIVVHVVGAVVRPGVYRLKDGQRVRDAIGRAGGPARAADPVGLNLAARVADGQQVVMPARAGAVGTGAGTAAGSATGATFSLSQATAEQLDELDGVGPATAEKIVAYRDEHGGFRSIDELEQVPGIGPKKLERLRGQLQP